jgi:hypothetical protein
MFQSKQFALQLAFAMDPGLAKMMSGVLARHQPSGRGTWMQ